LDEVYAGQGVLYYILEMLVYRSPCAGPHRGLCICAVYHRPGSLLLFFITPKDSTKTTTVRIKSTKKLRQ